MKSDLKFLLSKVLPGQLLKQRYRFIHSKAIKLDQLQLIYVPIPKVANHSIKKLLAHKIGLMGKLSAHKYDWNFVDLHTVPSSTNYSFGFVRNPLDRLVSCYVQKLEMNPANPIFWKYGKLVNSNMSFEEFANFVCKTPDSLADRHFKSQHQFLFQNDQLIVDFVGRFENLQEDWAKIALKFNLDSLDHINRSKRLNLSNYYSKELASKVARRYQKDIELLGYSSDVELFLSELS